MTKVYESSTASSLANHTQVAVHIVTGERTGTWRPQVNPGPDFQTAGPLACGTWNSFFGPTNERVLFFWLVELCGDLIESLSVIRWVGSVTQ